jgi:LysM repeat protein
MGRVFTSVILCAAVASGVAGVTIAAQSGTPQELVQRVNAFRASQGMSPLESHSALMAAAQRHADWMAATGSHSHQGEGGTMPQDRAQAAGYQGWVFENVASGTLGWVTTEWAVEGWAGSPGHRQAMLSHSAHIGAGIAVNAEEEFYVLLVGSLSPSAPEPPAVDEEIAPDEANSPDEASIVAVPIVVSTPQADGAILHVVQAGQTAWDIAARYGVGLDELSALNHLEDGALLHAGKTIIIRLGEGQEPPPLPTLPAIHVVQEGETLWTVAALHGLTLNELLALNSLGDDAIVHPGDRLLLRSPDPTPTETLLPTETPTTTPTLTPTATPETVTPSPTLAPAMAPALTSHPTPHAQDEGSDPNRVVLLGMGIVGALGLVFLVIGVVVLRRKRE